MFGVKSDSFKLPPRGSENEILLEPVTASYSNVQDLPC